MYDIFNKKEPFSLNDILEMAKVINDLNQIILDRYMKMVQFLEEKGQSQEYGIWHVERFKAKQNKDQN